MRSFCATVCYIFRECVLVAFRYPAWNAHARIFICGLPDSTVFFHIVSKVVQFSKKKKIFIEPKMRVWILYTTFVWNIYRSKKKWARYDKKCILVFM